MSHGINLIIVSAIRKGGAFLDEIVHPGCVLRMRQIDIAGLDQRGDGLGACHLSALGIDRYYSNDLVSEHLDDSRSVGLVLDQLCKRTGPAIRKMANRLDCTGTVHATADLIAEQVARADPGPHLSDDVVGGIEILERAIPGLDLLVNPLWRIDRGNGNLCAIRKLDDDRRKVGSAWLSVPPPVPL